MDFNTLFSDKRFGKQKNFPDGIRSEYQRDFDRLIFSSAFRRLQNKTQVFPLPGSSFVHNRLTHSLEVSSVGRSLGKIAGVFIAKNFVTDSKAVEFYKYELDNVVAAACLAHDIGNPAFGHSGESAISNYFAKGSIDESLFSKEEWADLTNFEGNANALRILTNKLVGNLPGGQRLTYTTLATIIKYPCESTGSDKKFKHLKKYGFFQSEKLQFLDIAKEFSLIQESPSPIRYCRHPFVYLLEAADDITYTIVDFEDAHRLGILEFEDISNKFFTLIECIARKEDDMDDIKQRVQSITNPNEKIAYLRSRSINSLILEASEVFQNNAEIILQGKFNDSLVGVIEKGCSALIDIQQASADKIYNHRTVVELELAGYNVMYDLLELIIPSVLEPENKRSKIHNKAIRLIPEQYGPFTDSQNPYEKCMAIVEFVSGMTDVYATELYRKIKGIEIGKHS
jgi:dGTPase